MCVTLLRARAHVHAYIHTYLYNIYTNFHTNFRNTPVDAPAHAPTQVLCLLGMLPTKVGDCEEEEGYEEKHARSVSVCERVETEKWSRERKIFWIDRKCKVFL